MEEKNEQRDDEFRKKIRNLTIVRYAAGGIFFSFATWRIIQQEQWTGLTFFIALGFMFIIEILSGRERERISFIQGQLDGVDQFNRQLESRLCMTKDVNKTDEIKSEDLDLSEQKKPAWRKKK